MAVRATLEAAHVRHVVSNLEGPTRAGSQARALIVDSWKRCASQYRLDPSQNGRTRILTSSELKDFSEPMSPLMHIARPILEDLYRHLEPIGYCVLFTDLHGVAFDFLSHPSLDEEHRSAGLYLGSVWTEETEGTNGVGTCIITGRPLTVHRSEHFRSKNADLSCTVSPVIDPGGNFAAVLDVSTARPDRGGATRYAEHLVRLTSCRLANAWFREQHRDRWVLRLFPDAENLDPSREGLVALDGDGAVVAMSATARRLLADGEAPGGAPRGGAAAGRSAPAPQSDEAILARLSAAGNFLDGPRFLPKPAAAGAPLYLIPVAPARRRGGRAEPAATSIPCARDARPRRSSQGPLTLERIAGGDPRLLEAVRLARLARDGGIPLLVTGETGSGKTAFVHALHADAPAGPLIELDLGARDGGAIERLVSKALGEAGTLVLDDIAALPEAAQSGLLRALRVLDGRTGTRPTLVSTAQVEPAALQAGLRPDLYFRLAGLGVAITPFRRRPDRREVIETILAEIAAEIGCLDEALSGPALESLAASPWPGNMREIRSAVRLALMASGAEERGLADLVHLAGRGGAIDAPVSARVPSGGGPIVDQAVEDLERQLVANQWCVSKVARQLSVDRSTIHRRMNRFGLVPPQRRT